MASVAELVPVVGVTGACEAVGVARASFYREARRRRARRPPSSAKPEARGRGRRAQRHGERGVMGQRAAEAEAIVALSRIVRDER